MSRQLRRRHLYVMLFAAPAVLASIIVGGGTLAAAAGVLWLFVFGDDPWPPAADAILGGVFFLTTVGTCVVLLWLTHTVGKAQERHPALNTTHLILSIGATVVLAGIIAVRVFGLGTAASRTDSVVCADLCRADGFAGSGMPPRDSGDRTCSCYDEQGREARRIPLGPNLQ